MCNVLNKLLTNKIFVSLAAGLSLVLAFPPIEILPIAFLSPLFLNALILSGDTFKKGFKWGFLSSLAIMVGAFYWVVYVLHVFGYVPWVVAGLLFVGFCGFGALNFPLFGGFGNWIVRKTNLAECSPRNIQLWMALGFPALFTFIEYVVPKLFPWYMGHALYTVLWANQIVELTGSSFLTFAIYSLGSVLSGFLLWRVYPFFRASWKTLFIPLGLWTVAIGFSLARLESVPLRETRPLRVALIQANIGSLEKAQARKGQKNIVRWVLDRYLAITSQALLEKPDLILWPETAMPFYLIGPGTYAQEIRNAVREWNVPLLSGAYAPYNDGVFRDYNAAFLLDPKQNLSFPPIYHKNILLAFGEYLPFGEHMPFAYEWFPQIANFKRGTTQEILTLHDGTRIGTTICYEAIVPSFYRRVAEKMPNLIVNLTNDSWFGPTSEPYQHAALSVFRAIETRIPFVRVTNTGLSFTVDALGQRSDTIGVSQDGYRVESLAVPVHPPLTFYLRYGEWFVVGCLLILIVLTRRIYASLFVRLGRGRPTH